MHRRITRSINAPLMLLALCVFFFVFGNSELHAQSLSLGTISLETNPEYPAPKSLVSVSLNDYSVNALGATIQWFIDGVEQGKFKNERSIQVTAGNLGEKKSIRVVLTRAGAPTLSNTVIISSNIVDIVLEAQTYVPTFYKGRALPSSESTVRAIALMHDKAGGIKDTYTYKWSLGDTVLLGGPVKGKYVLEQKMPRFEDSELTVEVFDTKGSAVGRHTILLNPAQPELHFYEYTPLRGLSERASSNPLALIGEETTIFGEPYYLNARMRGTDAKFTWLVDGNEAGQNLDAPNTITLRQNGISGKSFLSFSIRTLAQIPQYVTESLQLVF